MPDRRTQSYAAVPREIHDDIAEQVRTGVFARVRMPAGWTDDPHAPIPAATYRVDPEDPVPELPPSPTFWPRDEPKEPQR